MGSGGRESGDPPGRPPDPNNPMEYCSRVPPPQQVAASPAPPPPTVMVPVGVLKREGEALFTCGFSYSSVFYLNTQASLLFAYSFIYF